MALSGSIGGALKLKGGKPTGIDKKAKKKKKPEEIKAIADDDAAVEQGLEVTPDDIKSAAKEQRERLANIQKTESEKRFEETRRKRVRLLCDIDSNIGREASRIFSTDLAFHVA